MFARACFSFFVVVCVGSVYLVSAADIRLIHPSVHRSPCASGLSVRSTHVYVYHAAGRA